MNYAKITGTGSFVPEKVLTNAEIRNGPPKWRIPKGVYEILEARKVCAARYYPDLKTYKLWLSSTR